MTGCIRCLPHFRAAICSLVLIHPVNGFCGGFLSRPSKNIHTEKTWSGQRFEFIVTATNFPDLAATLNSLEQRGTAMTLGFAFSPVADPDLINSGYSYSAESYIGLTGGLVQTLLRGTRFLIGSQKMTFQMSRGTSDGGTKYHIAGNSMPAWGLAHFLERSETYNNLYISGFMSPVAVLAPTLSENDQHFFVNYQQFSPPPRTGAISVIHVFGTQPELTPQFHCSVENSVQTEGFVDPQLPSRKTDTYQPVVKSNIAAMARQYGANHFFLFIGLTHSGKWGYLAVIYQGLFLEAIRRDLYEAMKYNRDDFDHDPSGAGATGGVSTPVH